MERVASEYYALPDKREDLVRLVKAIPSEFYFDVLLGAPKTLYRQNRVAKNTRLVISAGVGEDLDGGKIEIIGVQDEPGELPLLLSSSPGIFPDLLAVLDGKLFSSLYIKSGGLLGDMRSPLPSVEAEQNLFYRFLSMGYEGRVAAYDNIRPSGASAQFRFDDHAHPPLALSWVPSRDGRKQLEGILSVIQELQLSRAVPAP